MYQIVVALAVAAHFAFIAYLVVGGFIALRWRRTIWLHVPAVLWGVAITTEHLDCPLTWVERWGRAKAGMPPLPSEGFITHYNTGVLYPASWVGAVQVVVFSRHVLGAVCAAWLASCAGAASRPASNPGRPAGMTTAPIQRLRRFSDAFARGIGSLAPACSTTWPVCSRPDP